MKRAKEAKQHTYVKKFIYGNKIIICRKKKRMDEL
jgi:hypothetical protein